MHPQEDDIQNRLAIAWRTGSVDQVCVILIEEVQTRCVKSLLFKYGNELSYEDCEDCFDCGVEKLLLHTKTTEQVSNPYNYVWICAINEAKDILRERGQLVHFDPDWVGSGDEETLDEGLSLVTRKHMHPEASLIIAEVALDVELKDSDVGKIMEEVVDIAVSRLTPQRQHLMGMLREHDPFMPNGLLAELLSASEDAVRSLKCRAFGDLRMLIPAVAQELGVDIERFIVPEPEVVTGEPPSLPSSDEDVEPTSL